MSRCQWAVSTAQCFITSLMISRGGNVRLETKNLVSSGLGLSKLEALRSLATKSEDWGPHHDNAFYPRPLLELANPGAGQAEHDLAAGRLAHGKLVTKSPRRPKGKSPRSLSSSLPWPCSFRLALAESSASTSRGPGLCCMRDKESRRGVMRHDKPCGYKAGPSSKSVWTSLAIVDWCFWLLSPELAIQPNRL